LRVLTFRLDRGSGVPAYLQIVAQVHEAIRFGRLSVGEQLPTVKEVAAGSGLNPNTVLRAYRELAAAGVVESRQGSGTFVRPGVAAVDDRLLLVWRAKLARWIRDARVAGLPDDDVRLLLRTAIVDVRAVEETA
jgi:GntR family transcriptional regulator